VTKQKFITQIKATIKECWEKNPEGHKSLENAIIWTSCYFQATEMHESYKIKDWAHILKDGFTPVNTVEDALEYWGDIFESAENSAEAKRFLRDEVNKIKSFYGIKEKE
jgi:hypothetical protein